MNREQKKNEPETIFLWKNEPGTIFLWKTSRERVFLLEKWTGKRFHIMY